MIGWGDDPSARGRSRGGTIPPPPTAPVVCMHGSWPRWPLAAFVLLSLAACNSTPKCVGDDEYLQAIDRHRLDLPANVTASERMAPLVIPPAAPDPETLAPPPNCLDEPPPYFKDRAAPSPAPPASDSG